MSGRAHWLTSKRAIETKTGRKAPDQSEAQIVGILKELGAGSRATELGRRHGIHPNTILEAVRARRKRKVLRPWLVDRAGHSCQ